MPTFRLEALWMCQISLQLASNMEGCSISGHLFTILLLRLSRKIRRSGTTAVKRSGRKVFQSGLMSNHTSIWFYMVVGKWFAPCGKCEEKRGRWAWVTGELSLRGMEVLPLSAGLPLLFTFQTEELRGTRKGGSGRQERASKRPNERSVGSSWI